MLLFKWAITVKSNTRQEKGELIVDIAIVKDHELERYITNIMLDI